MGDELRVRSIGNAIILVTLAYNYIGSIEEALSILFYNFYILNSV